MSLDRIFNKSVVSVYRHTATSRVMQRTQRKQDACVCVYFNASSLRVRALRQILCKYLALRAFVAIRWKPLFMLETGRQAGNRAASSCCLVILVQRVERNSVTRDVRCPQ